MKNEIEKSMENEMGEVSGQALLMNPCLAAVEAAPELQVQNFNLCPTSFDVWFSICLKVYWPIAGMYKPMRTMPGDLLGNKGPGALKGHCTMASLLLDQLGDPF